MEKGTTYVALDDSKRKIVAGILRAGDTQPELREIANDPRQIRRLFERLHREGPVAACYEAGVSGYDLHRQITALGVACEVIAPALTPRRPGQRIKTDRRDAAKLVRLFRAGELTAIHVPDEAEEAVRDLVRCRDDIRRDVLRWRHRVLKLLARHGRAYLAGKNWSQGHWRWIREQRFELPPLQRAFEATLFALEQALARQAELVGMLHPAERGLIRDDPAITQRFEGSVHRAHAMRGAGLQERGHLLGGMLPDHVAQGRGGDHDLAGQDAARPIGARQQLLGDHPLEAVRQLHLHLLLPVRREDIEDAVDRLRGVGRVERGQDQVAGLGRGHGRRDRLEVAHLAHDDDVRILPQHVDEGSRE